MAGSVEASGWLRLRMALVVVAAVAAVAAVGWSVAARLHRAATDAVALAAARGGADRLAEIVGAASDEMGATLGSLVGDDELTAAVASRDALRLLAVAGPRFHALRLHHGMTHWSYWEPESVATGVRGLRNLVRLGSPTLRGDVVERETLARVVREKALVYGIELGYTGFGLRVVQPVRDRGRLVGYVELGRNFELILAELGRRTGDEFVCALDKAELEPRRWASARAGRGERNDWDDHAHVVLAGNPAHADGLPAVPLRELPLAGGAAALGLHAEGSRTFARGAFALLDGAGRRVGVVFVFRDVSELARRAATLRVRAAVELGLAAAAAAGVIGLAFELLAVRRRASGAERPPSAN